MKTTIQSLRAVILGGGLLISGCATVQMGSFRSVKDPALAAPLKSFVAEKQEQANAGPTGMPSEFQEFFALAARGDWLAVSNAFIELRRQHAGQTEPSGKMDERWHGTAWQTVVETWGALEAFGEGDEKYSTLFGTNIIASIPAGSIYFGGTEAGYFVIAALQKSHVRAEPFFTLGQSLANTAYLEYLRGMYGAKIYIPTNGDLEKCFQDYTRDVTGRRRNNQLKPGETAVFGPDGKVQDNNMMAVVQVKGLMAKLIFDKNPDRDFYIEESFPFDWLYPYLQPHGLILKINRQPLPALSSEIVQHDHDYWRRLVRPMIGDWLTDDTSIDTVAFFARNTFGTHDFDGFTGDRRFIQNAYSHKAFAKLRNSLAGLYAWRMQHATSTTEKERMARQADFAFRQAWAMCPDSMETIFGYVAFLTEQKRGADALLVAETAAQMPSMQDQVGNGIRQLVVELKRKAQQEPAGRK